MWEYVGVCGSNVGRVLGGLVVLIKTTTVNVDNTRKYPLPSSKMYGICGTCKNTVTTTLSECQSKPVGWGSSAVTIPCVGCPKCGAIVGMRPYNITPPPTTTTTND